MSGQEDMFDVDEGVAVNSESSDAEKTDLSSIKNNLLGNDNESSSDKMTDLANSSSDSGDDDEESNEADEELAAFDAKLAQALGIKSADGDSSSHDPYGLSDEDMNDEQMEALDEHLEKVFRERKKITSKKSQTKDAKESIVNFKCRVLELLEIFVKERHSDRLTMDLLIPLLMSIQMTKSSLVSRKACNVVREYGRLCKGKNLPDIEDVDEIVDILKAVHSQASQGGSNAFATACSQASLLIVKVLASKDKENLRKALLVYHTTQEQALFDQNCKVKNSFFFDWLNWCSSLQR